MLDARTTPGYHEGEDAVVKVRDAIAAVEDEGWSLARMASSHRTFTKEGETAIITISGHLRDDLSPGQLAAICRLARIDKNALIGRGRYHHGR